MFRKKIKRPRGFGPNAALITSQVDTQRDQASEARESEVNQPTKSSGVLASRNFMPFMNVDEARAVASITDHAAPSIHAVGSRTRPLAQGEISEECERVYASLHANIAKETARALIRAQQIGYDDGAAIMNEWTSDQAWKGDERDILVRIATKGRDGGELVKNIELLANKIAYKSHTLPMLDLAERMQDFPVPPEDVRLLVESTSVAILHQCADWRSITVGSVNPMTASMVAEVIAKLIPSNDGALPFVTPVRISLQAWRRYFDSTEITRHGN